MTTINFGKFLHGGDYNPDQWLHSPETLEKDIEYFKKAHINTVSLGIFSWSLLEPREDEFHFDWLEDIINHLYENGISTILGTPSSARPRWLAEKYPEVLRVREDRRRHIFGIRENHCYTSPAFRKRVRIMNMELAKRFGGNPAVIAWHVSNEYRGECHCPLCQEAFRKWVEKKYKTVENLNRAWNTPFWSHIYDSFDQVEGPSSIGEDSIMGLTLDWRRFSSEQTADFAGAEIQAIRDAGSDKTVTTNLVDHYYTVKKELDFVSMNNYPVWGEYEDKVMAIKIGADLDDMRSYLKKPFFIMESTPATTNWQPVSALKRPGILYKEEKGYRKRV